MSCRGGGLIFEEIILNGMKNIETEKRESILLLNHTLEQAKAKLKEEFIGIDTVIDQLTDMCRAWFVFPEYQTRPTVLNLWGMTGVGKSSLVKRFCELIQFNQRMIQFDLGSSMSESWSFQNSVREISEANEGRPLVIVMDEFQHAKTVTRNGEELDRPSARMIWEILDSGKFSVSSYEYGQVELNEAIAKLREVLFLGVVVEDGRIKDGLPVYYKIFSRGLISSTASKSDLEKFKMDEDHDQFVPLSLYSTILELLPKRFATNLVLWEELKRLNGPQTITFLRSLYEESIAPKTIDCSKSLVFVLGNLDSAYTMSKNISTDLDADMFYRNSLSIKLPDIKRALLERFRPEQLSRLGNNHIIYPAFSNESYKALIRQALKRIQDNAATGLGIALTFDESVEEMLYQEGVLPTQGTRPLYSTIQNLIESQLPKIITSVLLKKVKCDGIAMTFQNDQLIASCHWRGKETLLLSEYLELPMRQLRMVKKDDKQAVIAVHEAGHAIVHMALFHYAPEKILAHSTDSMLGGFTLTQNKNGVTSQADMINKITVLLSGLAAEALLFDRNHITDGPSNDLEEATRLASQMVRELGMGTGMGRYKVRSDFTNDALFSEERTTQEMEAILTAASENANNLLMQYKSLLVLMADYLSDKREMNRTEITSFVQEHSDLHLEDDISVFEHCYYRTKLKELAKKYADSDVKSLCA